MRQSGQTASAEESRAAIRRTVADAEKYQIDPDPFVALHTADAIIVNIAGRRVFGRDSIYEAMKNALATPLAKVLTKTEIEDIRFASSDVAIVSCVKHVSDERDASPNTSRSARLPSKGALTYVMVKEQNAWRIAAALTTPIIDS
jgi:uncharacterized protein (TIGR02246 family)